MFAMPHLQRGHWVRAGKLAAWGIGAALLYLALVAMGFVPLARFTQEEVHVTVHPDHMEVDGSYLFENPHRFPIRQTCTFPVATGEGIGPATGLRVYWFGSRAGTDDTVTIPLHDFLGTPWFAVTLGPNENIRFQVHYRQDTPRHRGGYVVTSTQSWGRPLDSASFRIRCYGARIVQSSYPLAATDLPDALGFDWRGFMPEHDWTFAWEVL